MVQEGWHPISSTSSSHINASPPSSSSFPSSSPSLWYCLHMIFYSLYHCNPALSFFFPLCLSSPVFFFIHFSHFSHSFFHSLPLFLSPLCLPCSPFLRPSISLPFFLLPRLAPVSPISFRINRRWNRSQSTHRKHFVDIFFSDRLAREPRC